MVKNVFNEEDVSRTYDVLGHSKQTELRLIDPHKKEPPKQVFVSTKEDFIKACREWNGKLNIYAGINERRLNGTKQEDILSVKTVVIDIDAQHPKDEGASDKEMEGAYNAAHQIIYDMVNAGYSKPNLMMSGNGFQLWFSIPMIDVSNGNRASLEEKLQLFHREMISKYSGRGCVIDNIGDLPRIIKVAGTLSVKGKNTAERPHRRAVWVDFRGREDDMKLRDHIMMLEPPKQAISVIEPKGVDTEFLETFIREDKTVTSMLHGDYDEERYKSRSEAEMSACIKMFKKGFSKEQVGYIMQKCSLIGWNEKDRSYQELTMKKGLEFASKLKEQATVGTEGALWTEAFGSFAPSYLDMAVKFLEIQPLHYDLSKMWWQWNAEKGCWGRSDETNIMNAIDVKLKMKDTTEAGIKQEILEALRRKARLNEPEAIKETWIQFKDRIYDVNSGECFDASPKYMSVNPIPWELGESEDTPNMDRIITQWVGEKYLPSIYEMMAFCLSPNYFIHRIFCFMGAGCNGKGRCQAMIQKFIGDGNYCAVDLDDLLNNNFQSAKMYKKLVCFMSETNFSTMRKTSKLKALTGQDACPMEFKNLQPFEAVNYAKILVSTNSLPITEDKTDGFYRRWMLIDFLNKFSEEKDILAEVPDVEYGNLARKCLRLLKEVRARRTFTNEGTVEERARAYEDRSNPLKKFLRERCDVTDINASMPWWEFYELFIGFLAQNGMRIISKPEVSRLMKEDGYEIRKDHMTNDDGERSTVYMLIGVKIKTKEKPKDEKQQTII